MKAVIKKIIVTAVLVCVLVISGLATLIIFPQSLFANKIQYEKFNVYSDKGSDIEGMQLVLGGAYQMIESCELYDSNYVFDIFISDTNIFNKIESLQGQGPIARATAGNIIFKVPVDFKHNLAYGPRSKVNLTELLAHEMIHILQANKYGIINFSPIKHPPLWKLEGYPEYVSRQAMLKTSNYNLAAEIKLYNDLAAKSSDGFVEVVRDHYVPLCYYKGRLMIEYLIDIEGLTYDQILDDGRSEQQVFNALLEWSELK